MKKKLKKFSKDAMGLTATGIGLSVGAKAMGETGASAVSVGKFTGAMPKVSKIMVAGHLIGMMPTIKKKRRSKK